jgi:redox-sensitive bicupin YhaK (pirin superfamily)
MSTHPIKRIGSLGFPWETSDPFLFCAFHDDAYPHANQRFGPAASLAGRDLGQDFSRKDGWSMYHGLTVPGFPAHPHRGFETVTIVRRGLIDHSDSLGATARFGRGDVQWVTAGRGIVHSEMFPLLAADAANPVELLQIWLNLPARAKMSEPYFTMLWSEQIPRLTVSDAQGGTTEVAIIAGRYAAQAALTAIAPPPPPSSWAAQSDTDVAIWTVRMSPGAQWTLPAAATPRTRRTLYFFQGRSVLVAGRQLDRHAAIELSAGQPVPIVNAASDSDAEFLLLQGKPISEPVAQHGPFVMNTRAEIQQAFQDFERTRFGGWPWPDDAPVHGPEPVRFAQHADGRKERPES